VVVSDPSQPSSEPVAVRERFEATVHSGDLDRLSRLADLDLDRVPDPEGGVRILADLDTCAELVREGFEIRLLRSVPTRPLNASAIPGDHDVRGWLDDRLRGVAREETR
jgi:hypothetical protein